MRRSAAARLLRSWVRIPPGAWMFVCCECCVLSGRGLCDELIIRPEESYRLCCVVVCDLETSRMRRPWPALGRSATKKMYCWNTVVYWHSLLFFFKARSQNIEKQLLASSRMLSVCPSVRMEQIGSSRTDFHGIWYLLILRKYVEKTWVSLKSDKCGLHVDGYTFMKISRWILLIIRNTGWFCR